MKTALVGHVHLIAGGGSDIETLTAFLEEEGMKLHGNPDVYVRAYTHFGVDEARELSERAVLRAMGNESRIFIIAAATMTTEAQNALLKTLEEPPANALFFILVPSPDMLLSTLRSRAQRLELPKQTLEEGVVDGEVFLRAAPEKRIDLLKPLLEKGDDDKRDMAAILTFLASLERSLAKEEIPEGLEAVYRARKYVLDKGALVKPLLEQAALLIPRVK